MLVWSYFQVKEFSLKEVMGGRLAASMVESPICPLGKVLFWRGAISRGEDGPRHLLRLLGSWCFILWVCTYKMETSPVNSAASGFMDTLVCMQQPAGLRVPSPLRQLQQPWGSLMPRCPQILNSQRKIRQGCPFCPPRWRDTAQPGTCCSGPQAAGVSSPCLAWHLWAEPLWFFTRGKKAAWGGG